MSIHGKQHRETSEHIIHPVSTRSLLRETRKQPSCLLVIFILVARVRPEVSSSPVLLNHDPRAPASAAVRVRPGMRLRVVRPRTMARSRFVVIVVERGRGGRERRRERHAHALPSDGRSRSGGRGGIARTRNVASIDMNFRLLVIWRDRRRQRAGRFCLSTRLLIEHFSRGLVRGN